MVRLLNRSPAVFAAVLFALAGARGEPLPDGAIARRGTAGQQQRCAVYSVLFSRNGRKVIAGGVDFSESGGSAPGAVRIWDVGTGRLLRRFGDCDWGVRCLTLSPDGRMLAGVDGRGDYVCLWDADTGDKLYRLDPRHADGSNTNAVAFSSDGKTVATTGRISDIQLWDVRTGRRRRRLAYLDGGHALTFSPDGERLAFEESGTVFLCDVRSERDFWTERNLWHFTHPGRGCHTLAFSPQGDVIAAAGTDGTVVLLAARSGKELRRCRGHRGGVNAVAISPDGKTLASAGEDGTIRVWETATGQETRRFSEVAGEVHGVCFSPDGRILASGGRGFTVLLWDRTGLLREGRLPDSERTDAERRRLWATLAVGDAAAADRAVWFLVTDRGSVGFLKERLQAVQPVAAERLARWIADLDSDNFAVREEAEQQLEALDELAAPALRKALTDRPSLELRRRAEGLLVRLETLPSRQLRQVRALAVLEQIGDAQARRLLEVLAAGAPTARQTREARASLARLARLHPPAGSR